MHMDKMLFGKENVKRRCFDLNVVGISRFKYMFRDNDSPLIRSAFIIGLNLEQVVMLVTWNDLYTLLLIQLIQ